MQNRRRTTAPRSRLRSLLLPAAIAAFVLAWLVFTSTAQIAAAGPRRRVRIASSHHSGSAPQTAEAPTVATGVTASSGAPLGAARVHELQLELRPAKPLTPLLTAEPAVDAPKMCGARAHTELEGGVVGWGTNNVVADAAACCEACRAQAAKVSGSPKPGCNVWVFCADRARCGEKHGQCWLKRAADPSEPAQRGGGAMWTSGTVLPAETPAESFRVARRQRRADRQQAALTVLSSRELTVGLRNETGTIELLTPRPAAGQPHFSYALPLYDAEVDLGRGQHLDRSSDAFHHLGDFTLRTATRGGERAACSSVATGQVAAAAAGGGAELVHGADADEAGGALWRHSRDTRLQKVRSRARSGDCPLAVRRHVIAESGAADGAAGGAQGGVQLRLDVRNPSAEAVELEALGLSMPFDQDFVGRSLTQVAHQCSFVEPFLGMGGGYVQVTRATGVGPVLLLLPLEGTEFEAWRPLRNGEDGMRLDFMFEMSYELVLHGAGYARHEWARATPWNSPTSARYLIFPEPSLNLP